MTIKRVLLFGAIAAAVGCTGQNPNSTEPTSQNAFEAQVPQADRQLMSTDGATVENLISQLPARISEADAASMLVQIDAESIAEIPNEGYGVLRSRGGGGHGGYRGGPGSVRYGPSSGGHYRGSSWRGGHYRGGRGYGYYGRHRGYLSSFGYYGYGGYYWPYYLSSGYYYPYFSSGYYPYLSLAGGLYNPYYYWNPFFNAGRSLWSGIGTGYMWPGMTGGEQGMPQQQPQQPQQPAQPTASPTADTGTDDTTTDTGTDTAVS